MPRFTQSLLTISCILLLALTTSVVFAEDSAQRPRRLLLIGQGPDGHKPTTHEYLPAMHIIARLLHDVENLQTIVTNADEPWADGRELLDGADGAVVFLSQGANWLQARPKRIAAFERLAERGGALVVLHWGMGTKRADEIERFVNLFGGCHGGPDRKYKVLDTTAQVVANNHPVTHGLKSIHVHEEFYYKLKIPKHPAKIVPLIQAEIDGNVETVSWAWQRPNGGRSFGFSGLHFHDNWRHETYRRLVKQGILWSLQFPIPKAGVDVKLEAEFLKLKPR